MKLAAQLDDAASGDPGGPLMSVPGTQADGETVTALLRELAGAGITVLEAPSLHGALARLPAASAAVRPAGRQLVRIESDRWALDLDVGMVRSVSFTSNTAASGEHGGAEHTVRLHTLGGDDLLRAVFPLPGDRREDARSAECLALWRRLRERFAGPAWIAETTIRRRGPAGWPPPAVLQRCYDDLWATREVGCLTQTGAGAVELFGGLELPVSVVNEEGVLDVNEGSRDVHVHLTLDRIRWLRFYDDARGPHWRRFLVKFSDATGCTHLDFYLPNPFRGGLPGTAQPPSGFQPERERAFYDLYEKYAQYPGTLLVQSRSLQA